MGEAATTRILLVEDDANDAELAKACLDEATRAGAQIVHAASLAEGLLALAREEVHITLLDLDLPDSSGFETLEKLRAAARGPVIVVTGNPHPALVAEALKRHAYKVLRKSELDERTLMSVVRHAMDDAAHSALAARLRASFEQAAVGIAHLAEDGRFELVNRRLCELLGYADDELFSRTVLDVSHPDERAHSAALRSRLWRGELDSFSVLKRCLRKDGKLLWLELAVSVVRDGDGAPSYEIAFFQDVSARITPA